MSLITLCLTGTDLSADMAYLKSCEGKIDLAELRLDCLDSLRKKGTVNTDEVETFVRDSSVPLILTIRRTADGGFYSGSEKDRTALMADLVSLGFAYADLEDDLESTLSAPVEKMARTSGVRIIRSFHYFRGVPEDLAERIRRNGEKGDLPKGAVTFSHSRDMIPFLEACRKLEGVEKILLAMGERGFFTRILTEKLQSFLTFTSPADGTAGASGHLDPELLISRYRYREIRSDWPLFGIIGNPVIQSRSPELHNGWLEKSRLPGVYVPFLLDDLEDFSRIDELLCFQGLSVTIPFKEKIIPFLDSPSEGVSRIGACNTFYRKNGAVMGENSDAPGFLYPLLDRLGLERNSERPLEGMKCTLIGAGGASRGVLFALIQAGADVLVLNRTVEKAEKLADEFGARAAVLGPESKELMSEYNHVIVQTTSMGMAPMEERDPVDFYDFTGEEFLYDIIYKPAETVLMKRAARSGCRTLGGWEMLREQGKVQFELFTGQPVPKG